MKWDQIQNNWQQAGDRIKLTWGKLSEDDLTAISGNRQQLSAILQDRYQVSPAKVEEMINQFADEMNAALAHS